MHIDMVRHKYRSNNQAPASADQAAVCVRMLTLLSRPSDSPQHAVHADISACGKAAASVLSTMIALPQLSSGLTQCQGSTQPPPCTRSGKVPLPYKTVAIAEQPAVQRRHMVELQAIGANGRRLLAESGLLSKPTRYDHAYQSPFSYAPPPAWQHASFDGHTGVAVAKVELPGPSFQ